jgi:F1F0 ATPase subunit 2
MPGIGSQKKKQPLTNQRVKILMNEFAIYARSLAVGLGLGTIFFAGLWWTIRKGTLVRQPAFLFLVSLLLRMALVVGGGVFVARGGWQCILLYFVGLMWGRLNITWLTRVRHAS